MAVPKVCGLETEYGIIVRGPDLNAVTASSLLINSYVQRDRGGVGWDFHHEHPGNDARGFSIDFTDAPEVEYHLVNTVLENGARYYVDHAHPEISTPECRTAFDAVLFDRAAEEIVRASMGMVSAILSPDQEIVLYKNNSDGKGNSYGCHENYLVDRTLPFGRLASLITGHFVTRQIFTGAGKVGCELPGADPDSIPFQISQRSDFFEEEVGLETTLKRPIVNTRDEPHCDPQKYRRLHVIVGDANLSEIATYLKVGTTAMVLAMIEDSALGEGLILAHPVPAMRQVSYDTELRALLLMNDGRRMTALDIQWWLLEAAQKYEATVGLEAIDEVDGRRLLATWEEVLQGLERDPESQAHTLDWVAKRRLIRGYAQRHSLPDADPRLKAIDLQYSDMRSERGLSRMARLHEIVPQESVRWAMDNPPEDTRAYFRGRCLQKWPENIAAANWDSLVFDVGDEPLRRVEMNEPLKGTRDLLGHIVESAESASDLLEQLAR